MKTTKQKFAIGLLAVLLIITVYTGLIKPYIKNKDTGHINSNASSEEVRIPNFQFADREGNTVDFDSFRGKPTVINFWGTWCGFCVMEMRDFNEVVEEYGDDVNFLFLHVANSADTTVESVLSFLSERELDNITTHFDDYGHGTYVFGINSFPTTVYADAEGNLYNAKLGLTNKDQVTKVLDEMLG